MNYPDCPEQRTDCRFQSEGGMRTLMYSPLDPHMVLLRGICGTTTHSMSWSIGYDKNWQRDIGYGVPAFCDHPGCGRTIDRGLGHVCGAEPYGGERGCGLYFCDDHQVDHLRQLCARCYPRIRKPFAKVFEHPDWLRHKLKDRSWKQWREENPEKVHELSNLL